MLGPALSEVAYNRFYYDFVIPWPGTLIRLRQQLREASPGSCLVPVVAAVAYANYHGRCNSPEAKRASGVHYGLALQRLATTMTDAVEMQRDEILMVIWLLGMYEVRYYPIYVPGKPGLYLLRRADTLVSRCSPLTGVMALGLHTCRVHNP
jgi:hypothetical protein